MKRDALRPTFIFKDSWFICIADDKIHIWQFFGNLLIAWNSPIIGIVTTSIGSNLMIADANNTITKRSSLLQLLLCNSL